ncbi:MAG: response regulator transcription factor [Nanoarchaeota archaeon]|nr:response regulator transcription factor [Nanoarchaeota archaeon]
MVKKILVVDDEPHISELVKAVLSVEGYDVKTASDGVSALKFLEKQKPDLVILDMMMPGMSGREVCEKIRANPKTKQLKVMFVTVVKFSENGKSELEKMNVSDYLTKPFDNAELVSRVKKVVGG